MKHRRKIEESLKKKTISLQNFRILGELTEVRSGAVIK